MGHAWTQEAPVEEKDVLLERALWIALRTLDERISLGRRKERTAIERGNGLVAHRCASSVAEASRAAAVLREFIRADAVASGKTPSEEAPSEETMP